MDAVEAETAERPITFNWDRLLADGRTNLTFYLRKYQIGRERVLKLLDAGVVPFVRGGHRGTTIRIFPEDIELVLEENKLALDCGRMAGVLRVKRGGVEMLASMGQLTGASDAVNILAGANGPAYVANSADELLGRVRRNATRGVIGSSVAEILETSERHFDRFGAALAILPGRSVRFSWYDLDPDWKEAILIEDQKEFLELMDLFVGSDVVITRSKGSRPRHVDEDVIDCQQVGYVEAARILGVNQSVVRDLGREGILPREPAKHTLFARSAGERFRDEYVFGPEMARRLGNTSPASVKKLLTARSIRPAILLESRKALIFRRREFEATLADMHLTSGTISRREGIG